MNDVFFWVVVVGLPVCLCVRWIVLGIRQHSYRKFWRGLIVLAIYFLLLMMANAVINGITKVGG
jgi:hypothetical protein